MKLHRNRSADIRRLYHRSYGKGLGSFLKSGLTAVKNTTKELGKTVAAKGKEVGKMAATNLKDAAKATLANAVASGKELLANAVDQAQTEAKRMLVEHGTQLSNALTNAQNFGDIGNALKNTAQNITQDVKQTTTQLAQNTANEAKQRAVDAAKHGVMQGVNAGVKTLMDVAGVPASEPTTVGAGTSISKLLARGPEKKKGGAIYLPGGSTGGGIYVV